MRDLERKRIREREYKKMRREDPGYVERLRSHARDYNRRLRQAVLERLGQKCSRCGYKDVRALEIDHKFGGGTEERRRLGYPTYYVHVLRHLDRFQILCANCNMIKRRENGEW